MKIAFFNCLARSVPPKKSGGIEKIIYHLVKGLINKGHQVTLFSTGDSFIYKNSKLVSIYPRGIEEESLSPKEKNRLNAQKTYQLGKILLECQKDFDIVHNHCLDAALPIIKKIKIKNLSTLHEDADSNLFKRIKNFKNHILVVPSNYQRKKLNKINISPYLIYHGIDLKNLPELKNPLPYLAFVGRISPQKNPHLAILVASQLKRKIILLGQYKNEDSDKEYYFKTFLPILKENARWVEWLGEVEQNVVYKVLNTAQTCLFPVGFDEPFGLAAIEAMAVGCPVVAFRRGAYMETVSDGQTGFLVNNLNEMIEKTCQTANLNRQKCQERVRQYFTSSKMVDAYERLYKKIKEEI